MSRLVGLLAILSFGLASAACEPELNVGAWPCTSSTGPAGEKTPEGGFGPTKDPVTFPWENGFEDGFCGYARAKGFCYATPAASYALVDTPVHSGLRAARFSVVDQPDPDGTQTRCVREGTLPADAVYGAWFYLTATASVTVNWNLMYFDGGFADDRMLRKQWDVSLGNTDDGGLTLRVLNQMTRSVLPQDVEPAIPVGKWFHLEFRWRRAMGTTGSVALYKDGALVVEAKDLQTEVTDTTWQQWYVGNLVTDVTPPESTLYVDDVSIAPPP